MAAIEAFPITGATVGISIAAPFGPSSMLCIQRTLGGGFSAGLAAGQVHGFLKKPLNVKY